MDHNRSRTALARLRLVAVATVVVGGLAAGSAQVGAGNDARPAIVQPATATTEPVLVPLPTTTTTGPILVPPTTPPEMTEPPETTAPPETTTVPPAPEPTPVADPAAACSAVPVPPPLDQDAVPWPHAQVIAQGIVEFGGDPLVWSHDELTAADWPIEFTSTLPVFVAADGPDAVLVSTTGSPWALLDAGEATFVPAGISSAVDLLLENGVASGHRITFEAGSGPGAFTPGAGRCDVNLVRDVLQPGELVEVSSPFPVLVVVTAGAVVDVAGSEFVAGDVATLGGDLELRNDGLDVAVVLVAAIGSGIA